jgi:hypothetical protein
MSPDPATPAKVACPRAVLADPGAPIVHRSARGGNLLK